MLVLATLCSLASTCIYASAECQIADHKEYFRERSKLRKTLFRDYDKSPAIVETFNSTSESCPKYELLLTLTYIKLTDMDEPEQKAEFITEYTIDWRDERLRWNPKDYCSMDHIYVLSSDVWFPDISFVDTHSSVDYRNDQHKFVRLNSSGHLYLNVETKTDTACKTETQNFPFDRQRCYVIVKSALYSHYEYSIKVALSPWLLSSDGFDDMGNEEWRVEHLTVENQRTDEKEINSITIWMRRCPSFYITMIIIPSFVTNVLSIIGILAKAADVMGKLGMALTSIMSLSLILGILAVSLPRSGRLPKIVIYVMANLLIVVIALTAALALANLKKVRSHSCEGKDSDQNRLDANKIYRKAAYVLIAVFEVANLINLIILIA